MPIIGVDEILGPAADVMITSTDCFVLSPGQVIVVCVELIHNLLFGLPILKKSWIHVWTKKSDRGD
jgi:hypothetical protein